MNRLRRLSYGIGACLRNLFTTAILKTAQVLRKYYASTTQVKGESKWLVKVKARVNGNDI